MDVPVRLRVVAMGMRMGLARLIPGRVQMLVMDVMRMGMLVAHRLVTMFMQVALGQVEPDAGAHQKGRDYESRF